MIITSPRSASTGKRRAPGFAGFAGLAAVADSNDSKDESMRQYQRLASRRAGMRAQPRTLVLGERSEKDVIAPAMSLSTKTVPLPASGGELSGQNHCQAGPRLCR